MVVTARFRIVRACLASALLFGGCAYQPGSFSQAQEPFGGVYATVDCLDLAVQPKPKPQQSSNVIGYSFGNRCDDPVVVDLAAVRVVGVTPDGSAVPLSAFDPFHELRVLRLDSRGVGHEAIDYPSGERFGRVCIDAASIAHVYPTRWICVDNRF